MKRGACMHEDVLTNQTIVRFEDGKLIEKRSLCY